MNIFTNISIFTLVNGLIGAILLLFYIYQLLFIPISAFRKPRSFPYAAPLRYAILISARNEADVIGILIDSIKAQNYPADMVDTWVIADNCTDNTAEIARGKGAFVVERENKELIGKGYAINYLLSHISNEGRDWNYDGYFVIDSDNILDPDFVAEMNKAVASGCRVATCYRNSKNYGDNWLSASYALWFLRESKYLNNARQLLGLSAACSGTGFVVHRDILEKYGGWNYFTLTEDVEFTFAMVAAGEKIGYCAAAIVYDEQPVRFKDSWKQRTRWVKGYFQAYTRYGLKLLKRLLTKGDFSCYDMLVSTFVGAILPAFYVLFYLGALIVFLVMGYGLLNLLFNFIGFMLGCYFTVFAVGLITTLTEWKKIYCGKVRKSVYCITFPLFLFSLLLITLCAPFSKERWSPVKHIRAVDLTDIVKGTKH